MGLDDFSLARSVNIPVAQLNVVCAPKLSALLASDFTSHVLDGFVSSSVQLLISAVQWPSFEMERPVF